MFPAGIPASLLCGKLWLKSSRRQFVVVSRCFLEAGQPHSSAQDSGARLLSVVVFPSVTATNYIRDSVPSFLLNNSSCNCVCYLNGNEMSVRHDRAVFVTVCVQLLSGVSAARSS